MGIRGRPMLTKLPTLSPIKSSYSHAELDSWRTIKLIKGHYSRQRMTRNSMCIPKSRSLLLVWGRSSYGWRFPPPLIYATIRNNAPPDVIVWGRPSITTFTVKMSRCCCRRSSLIRQLQPHVLTPPPPPLNLAGDVFMGRPGMRRL